MYNDERKELDNIFYWTVQTLNRSIPFYDQYFEYVYDKISWYKKAVCFDPDSHLYDNISYEQKEILRHIDFLLDKVIYSSLEDKEDIVRTIYQFIYELTYLLDEMDIDKSISILTINYKSKEELLPYICIKLIDHLLINC